MEPRKSSFGRGALVGATAAAAAIVALLVVRAVAGGPSLAELVQDGVVGLIPGPIFSIPLAATRGPLAPAWLVGWRTLALAPPTTQSRAASAPAPTPLSPPSTPLSAVAAAENPLPAKAAPAASGDDHPTPEITPVGTFY